jgi:hypothetical protein
VRAQAQQQQQTPGTAAAVQAESDRVHALDDSYNAQMAKQMGWANPFEVWRRSVRA